MSKIALIVCIHNGFCYWYLTFVLAMQFLCRTLYHLQYKGESKFVFAFSLFQVLSNLFSAGAYFTMSLKVDCIVDLGWDETFWWFWIIVGLFMALSLVSVLILANHYLSLMFGD